MNLSLWDDDDEPRQDRCAWIRVKRYCCYVWMRIPDGEPYPDPPPPGAAKRDWWTLQY